MKKILIFSLLFIISLVLVTCAEQSQHLSQNTSTSNPNSPLTIWWTKGFYPEEDEALQTVIKAWEQQAGLKAKLTLFSDDENLKQTLNALETENFPDIVYNRRLEFAINPKAAWEGKVAEVSDIIKPIKTLYTPSAIQSVYLYNQKSKKFGYYGVPLQQQTLHLHYWRDLLEEAGFQERDIPKDWNNFWAFWQEVQSQLRKQGKSDIYGIGLTFSSESNDTFYEFEQTLAASGIQLMNQQGELLVNNPEVRQGILDSLIWYTQFYKQGYAAPDSIDWLPEDNNINFLNRRLVMTLNPTLSIPASQKTDPDVYAQQIATIELPNKPNGEPMPNFVSIKQVITFKNSPHPQQAKSFLSFLAKPEILLNYLKGSAGRYFPVMPQLLSDPFWNNTNDPHLKVASEQFRFVAPLSSILFAPYSQIFAENVWGKAIEQVIVEGLSPEAATEMAIAEIQTIFAEWKVQE